MKLIEGECAINDPLRVERVERSKPLRVLHLSDTQLSGSPVRISNLLNKYSDGRIESKHITWQPTFGYRSFECDLIGMDMRPAQLAQLVYEWADVIHYHNRWRRQEIFRRMELAPPCRPSVIQMHSPRNEGEDFRDEVGSKIPLAIIAQYHVRQWPELSFIVPNVVDIHAPENTKEPPLEAAKRPTVSFAPSNTNGRGWNDKGYGIVAPVLKRMKIRGDISFQLLTGLPHREVMAKKRLAHIGIDEIVTGSYHLSSLEYLSLGIACFANIDRTTEKVVKELTGCEWLPWLSASESNFESRIRHVVQSGSWLEAGRASRLWMERYWNPARLIEHYERMYHLLVTNFTP